MRSSRRLRSLLLLAVSVALLAAGCGDDGDDEAEAATVTIRTFQLSPDPVVVAAGSTIRFVNEDAIDHTITAGTRESPEPERFDGQLPEQGAELELALDEPGTYPYFCSLHEGPGMTGEIVVE